ncbi:MAG: response regulator [Oscillospiraceae bacterium]
MKENVTILSIDDDPQICFALGELFKFQGWRAVSASDVASGLEAFRRYSPDIVLIDYHMPGVSGIEGVKLLRRQSSSVPIIVFTIDESQTVADTFLAAGASDFALKPIKTPRYRQPHQAAPALRGAEPAGAGALQGDQRRHAGYHYEFPLRAERLCDRE